MRRIDLLGILTVGPLLLAIDGNFGPTETSPPIDLEQQRLSLDQYNYELDRQVSDLVEAIAKLIPPAQIAEFRRDHYAWQLQRDRECAEKGRAASNVLVEPECRRRKVEEQFDRLRAKLDLLQPDKVDEPSYPDAA